jgi:general secretion pathway protein C
VIFLYLGLATFIAAHIVNAFVAHELRAPDMPPPPLPSQDSTSQNSVSPQQLAQDMMERGLFILPANFAQGAESSTKAAAGPPLDVAKKLLLHGTAIGMGDLPIAIVQDQSTKQQRLMHLHDHVPDVGEIVSIEKNRVLFQARGQEEWLELAILSDLDQARRLPPLPEPSPERPLILSQPIGNARLAGLKPVVSLASNISSASNSRPIHILDRGELSKIFSDIPLLLLQAQPVASLIDGRLNGILLEAVRADSLYTTMGLQSGDVLKRFNGMELRDPSMLISVFTQMKDEQRVKLDLVRDKTLRTFTYEIR